MNQKIVYETNSRMDAELIAGMLESKDIPTFVSCDDAAGLYPGMELYFGCKIFVHEENLLSALEIIQGTSDED